MGHEVNTLKRTVGTSVGTSRIKVARASVRRQWFDAVVKVCLLRTNVARSVSQANWLR